MPLSREVSLAVGLGTAAIVAQIYDHNLPGLTDARVAAPNDPELAATEKAATISAAVFVGLVAFVSKDPTALVFGGATVVALSWMHKHANAYNGSIGMAANPGALQVQSESPGYVPSY